MNAHNMAMSVLRSRGDIKTIHVQPGMGFVYSLTEGMADQGVELVEVQPHEVHYMGEARFVELLNDVRLSDKVLLVSFLNQAEPELQDLIRYNVTHALTNQGGRAILTVTN